MQLISELYKSIPETFTHRFACHVWQRIFEIEWSQTGPKIMSVVQEAVIGNWASIANDENGSLVVQCIFEHGDDISRAPIIEEIFKYTAAISKGNEALNDRAMGKLGHSTPIGTWKSFRTDTHYRSDAAKYLFNEH